MKNLAEDLGVEYVNEWVSGALIFKGGVANLINRVEESEVDVRMFSGTMAVIKSNSMSIPLSIFDGGFNSLEHPALGYRTAASGKILLQLRQRQSFKRGLQLNELTVAFPSVTHYIANKFRIDLDYYCRPEVKAVACTDKCFLTLPEGLQLVKDGGAYVFAVSDQLAVVPSHISSRYLDILFDGRIAGHVSPLGKVTGRIASSGILMEKLYG